MGVRIPVVAFFAVSSAASGLIVVSPATPRAFKSSTPVPCSSAAQSLSYVSPQRTDRVVLGRVTLPTGVLQVTSEESGTPWALWAKYGIKLRRASTLISLSVPREWRNRAAIAWG